MEIVLSVIFGGLITVLTAMWVEYQRRPRLRIYIEDPPVDLPVLAVGLWAGVAKRHLRVRLRNEPLPRIARWMQRAAALQCRAEITFHHLNDGQDVFSRAMAARWAKSPEPIASQILDLAGNVRFQIQDFSRTTIESRIDVYPGEEEILDIAVRFSDGPDCYGWNNESYFNNWRTPGWKLTPGRYLVRAVVTSSGQKCTEVLRLVNDLDQLTDFRLLSATREDRAKLR